jgi:putative ABC transport system permease protein
MIPSVRYGLRLMRRSPGFTLAAVLTLGLGIGANTAMFSVVYAVLLRPLPVEHPERLVFLSGSNPLRPGAGIPFSVAAYESLRDGNSSLASVAAFAGEGLTLTGAGDPLRLQAQRVSANFFRVLAVQPAAGRAFEDAEGRDGAAPVALVSDGLWQRRFGGDPRLLGQSITLAGRPHTLIGIVPRGFAVPFDDVDVWVTQISQFGNLTQEQIRHGGGFLMAIGRMKPGISVEQADADAGVVNRRYRAEHPGSPDAEPGGRIYAAPLQDSLISEVRSTILILAGAVGLVLLVACANVAGLTMARAAGRTKEMAVRAALGAGRRRIVEQLLVESVLLAVAGAATGALLAMWGVSLAQANLPLPGWGPVRVDLAVLGFCAGIAILTGVLFGLLPALAASRPNLTTVLRDAGRGVTGGRRQWTRRALVAGQMALSVVLLIGAALLVESVRQLERVQPGFDPHGAMTMRISMPPARYPDDARRTQFVRETLERIEALPGVRSATASLSIPMSVGVMAPFLAEGQPPAPIAERPYGEWKAITPGYFQTMGVPLLRGRAFTWADDAGAPRRVIVSQALARKYFGSADPIGKHVTYSRRQVEAEIVGVAGDVKSRSLDSDGGIVYYTPYPQFAWPNLAITFRAAAGDPRPLAKSAQAQVFAMDRDMPVTGIETLDEYVQSAFSGRRRVMSLIAGFAGVALLLAMVGLYGVMAYSVAERTAEIGIRQAVGAGPADILRLVVGEGLRLSVMGIGVGIAAAIAATRLISGMLYHVSPTDPATFAAIAAVILGVAMAACWIPARRATRVDPLEALRRQ